MMMLPLLEQRGAVPMAARTCSPSFLGRAGRALVCCDLIDKLDMLRIPAAWEDRDMNVIVTSGALAAALLWATDSIALEPKRPPSLPALDFSCYVSHNVTFTSLESTRSELGIAGDNYGKSLYQFTTVGESMVKVVEFPEFESMRKEYWKVISELSFDNTGSIFGWSDNQIMFIRIFVVNQRDRLVSLLEVPPNSQTVPYGTLRVLKCNDAAKTAPPLESQKMTSWSEVAKRASPILDRALWQSSRATFPKRLSVRAQSSVSPRSSSRAMVFKAQPLN